MARDYGVRAKHGRPLLLAAVLGLVAIGAVASVGDLLANNREAREEEERAAAYWTVKGPPCRRLDAAAARASPVRLRRGLDIEGVRFAHAYGALHCRPFETAVRDQVGGSPVCQFTAPGRLEVVTPAGAYHFDAGADPATVTVSGDVPTCVLAARFDPAAPDPGGDEE